MFGERCLGLPGCGHQTNWSCPCTCDEEIAREDRPTTPVPSAAVAQPPDETERLKAQIEGMALYVAHDLGCNATDLDYLDRTPCTCGLRRFYNPRGVDDSQGMPADVRT